MKLDNIHYSFKSIDGYNKPFNFVVSARWDGKTTAFTMQKMYPAWKKGRPTIVLKRNIADISDNYIMSFEGILQKYEKDVHLSYKIGELKEGIVDVYAYEGEGEKTLMMKVIALNKRTDQLKGLFIKNPAYMFLDELILQPHSKMDKYLDREAWKVEELFNTYIRESENLSLKFYACGNPYSLYNPYFVHFGIDALKLKHGTIQSGSLWVVDNHALHPELKAYLKANNPLYKESEEGGAFSDYIKYALNGEAIADANIKICRKCPEGFKLLYCFRYENAYIGIYYGKHDDFSYWAGQIKDEGTRRKIFAFSFNELVEGSSLLSFNDRVQFASLRKAVANRNIAFDSVESNYEIEEIYKHL